MRSVFLERDVDGHLLGAVGDGVLDQIDEHLHHPVAIEKPEKVSSSVKSELPAGMDGLDRFERLAEEAAEIDALALDGHPRPASRTGVVEKVPDHPVHPLDVPDHAHEDGSLV